MALTRRCCALPKTPMVRARRGSLCICLSTFGVQLLSFSWAFCGTWYPHFLPASQCPVQCTGRRWRSLLRVKIGDELNGFQLDEPLGAGAFGTTWRARATNQSDLKTLNLAEGRLCSRKFSRCDGVGATPCHIKVTINVNVGLTNRPPPTRYVYTLYFLSCIPP